MSRLRNFAEESRQAKQATRHEAHQALRTIPGEGLVFVGWLGAHLVGAVVGLDVLPDPIEAIRVRNRFAHGRQSPFLLRGR